MRAPGSAKPSRQESITPSEQQCDIEKPPSRKTGQ